MLEKLVHVDDPALLPGLVMVMCEAPDALPIEAMITLVGADPFSPDLRLVQARPNA